MRILEIAFDKYAQEFGINEKQDLNGGYPRFALEIYSGNKSIYTERKEGKLGVTVNGEFIELKAENADKLTEIPICIVEQEGFSKLGDHQYSEKQAQLYNEIFYQDNSTVWSITSYKYDSNNKKVEIAEIFAPQYENGQMPTIKISHTVNNISTTIEQDLQGNFVSKKVWYPDIRKENAEGETTYIEFSTENYDEKDNLLYKTTTKTQMYDKPQIVTDEDGEEMEYDSETEIIKEYPNGETYIEKEVLGKVHATLKDSNGNIVEEYDISKMYDSAKGKMEITKTYPDGRIETTAELE